MIQSASSGSGSLRYADFMSIVAILNLLMVASCRKREKVGGMMVGLYVVGSWTSALIMARRRCLRVRRLKPCACPVLHSLSSCACI